MNGYRSSKKMTGYGSNVFIQLINALKIEYDSILLAFQFDVGVKKFRSKLVSFTYLPTHPFDH